MDPDQRERIKAAFQASPAEGNVRILLATDAASEGIDLQNHCHELIHYEFPGTPTGWSSAMGGSTAMASAIRPDLSFCEPGIPIDRATY